MCLSCLGRHPCTGVKFAKLEIKILVALMFAGYEYDVVDSEGNFPDQLPKPDYNDIHQVCLTPSRILELSSLNMVTMHRPDLWAILAIFGSDVWPSSALKYIFFG